MSSTCLKGCVQAPFPRVVYLAKVLINLTIAPVNVNVSVHFSEGTDLFRGFAGALLAD